MQVAREFGGFLRAEIRVAHDVNVELFGCSLNHLKLKDRRQLFGSITRVNAERTSDSVITDIASILRTGPHRRGPPGYTRLRREMAVKGPAAAAP